MRITLFEDSLVIELAEGVGDPRMREVASGIWLEEDREGTLTKVEVLLDEQSELEVARPPLPSSDHVQIKCSSNNVASARVTERAGFRLARIEGDEPRREIIWIRERESHGPASDQ